MGGQVRDRPGVGARALSTLHHGKNIRLKRDGDDTLILDVQWGGRITRDQIALIEAKGMVEAEDGTWYGDAKHQGEVMKLVKLIDKDWVSREAERLAFQQVRGGR